MMSTRDPGGPDRARLEELLSVVGGLGELSRDVLAMASVAPIAPVEISAAEVVRSAAALARHHRVTPDLDLPAGDLRIRASRGPLVHALFNLIDNACQFCATGERPRVSVSRDGDRVAITIEDRGPGFPTDHPAGEHAVASTHGAGYGLLAARRFIEASGGGLSFAPRPGGGTCCRVSMPAVLDAPVKG
jgi:signal transduction histidine kinase